jgi:hypothetical protein
VGSNGYSPSKILVGAGSADSALAPLVAPAANGNGAGSGLASPTGDPGAFKPLPNPNPPDGNQLALVDASDDQSSQQRQSPSEPARRLSARGGPAAVVPLAETLPGATRQWPAPAAAALLIAVSAGHLLRNRIRIRRLLDR